MSKQEEIKFPLSKKAKAEFSEKYEAIFLKKPVHNISDEKLVEMVNSNLEKLTPNAEIQKQPSQEGIQDGEDQNQNGEVANSEDAKEDVIDTERLNAQNVYEQLNGEFPDENLSTEEIVSLNKTKLELNTASADYFGLFGKKPLQEMTLEQVLSANENERKRQGEAQKNKALKAEAEKQIEFNPETEMLIVNKKNKDDKRVINKVTFPFLKADFEEVTQVPKEIQNR